MARGDSKAAKPKSKVKTAAKNDRSKQGVPGTVMKHDCSVPLELQQKCLDIFNNLLNSDHDDTAILQEVKGHLYNRDFAAAFSKEDYLRVYASRWSPSRALGYMQVLADVEAPLLATSSRANDATPQSLRIVCIGGGAGAEVVALAGWLQLKHASADTTSVSNVDATFIDIAAWDHIVEVLHRAIVTAPQLSKYASLAAKEANAALLPEEAYSASFQQMDALTMRTEHFEELFGGADLVTLMFTLNELYSTSMAQTQRLLLQLTAKLATGALLLIVDSPGSYSTVSVNGAEKKYPMQWLLDYTLIGSGKGPGSDDATLKWEKLVSDESRWFRMPQGLKYPIELENMRYQIHLYRRLPESEDKA